MLPVTSNGWSGCRPATSRQSRLSASPSTIRAVGTRSCASGTRSRSFSIATTLAFRAANASVSAPGPGPISSTRSPGAGASAATIRSRMARCWRKCWPNRFRVRTLEPQHQQGAVVLGTGGEPVGLRHDSSYDQLGNPAPSRRERGQEPALAEALPRCILGVDQPVGPETEQVAARGPWNGPGLDGLGAEPERSGGGLEPLRGAFGGEAKGVGMAGAGPAELPVDRVEDPVEDGEVGVGRCELGG